MRGISFVIVKDSDLAEGDIQESGMMKKNRASARKKRSETKYWFLESEMVLL